MMIPTPFTMTIDMENLSFGDIVLIRFPFTDGSSVKKRAALILADTNDNDIVVCRITTKIYDSEYDLRISNWKDCGLLQYSVIRLHKIATLQNSLAVRVIGSIDEKLSNKVKNKFNNLIS